MTTTTKGAKKRTKKARARAGSRRKSTRERLAELLEKNPGVTSAELGRTLGVSRERVRQLRDSLGMLGGDAVSARLAEKPPAELLRLAIDRAGCTIEVFALDYLARDVAQVNDWLNPALGTELPIVVRQRLVKWLADPAWPRMAAPAA